MRTPTVVALTLLLALPAFAQKRRAVRHPSTPVVSTPRTIVLAPAKDNTLYQNDDGTFSNGVGIHVFAGNTAASSRRRALLAFDLTQIPPGSQVTRVSLKMTVSMSLTNSGGLSLHALLADWGEGSSNAGASGDGGGTPSRMNDATWIHRFFPAERWTTPGGDFTAAADAAPRTVSSNSVTWETAGMIARVQQWVDQPAANFGWIVIGDERSSRTAKRFDSREVTGATKPSLTVEYIPR
jgi:hypothetical protein